jgi:hypothetical protein
MIFACLFDIRLGIARGNVLYRSKEYFKFKTL